MKISGLASAGITDGTYVVYTVTNAITFTIVPTYLNASTSTRVDLTSNTTSTGTIQKAGVVVTDTRRRARATDTPADAASTHRPPTPLDFRHGIAVWLLQNGAPITDVASHLGHATVETTMTYLRTSDAHKRATFDRLWAGGAT